MPRSDEGEEPMTDHSDVIADRNARAQQAQREAHALLESVGAVAKRARESGDSALSLISPSGRAARNKLRGEIANFRDQVLHFDQRLLTWDGLYEQIGEDITAARFSLRAGIRSTISRHLDEAERSLNDAALRALARATMWISIAVLFVATVALVVALGTSFQSGSAVSVGFEE